MIKSLFTLAIAVLATLAANASEIKPSKINRFDYDKINREISNTEEEEKKSEKEREKESTKESETKSSAESIRSVSTTTDYEFYLPKAGFKRTNRNINSQSFIYKGEWMVGFNGSYGDLSTDDASLLLAFDNLSATLTMTDLNPFFGYFYKDNRAVGLRLGYSDLQGTIDSGALDLGDTNDISFDLPYISTTGRYYSASVFHRAYASLDKTGHFGLFAEVELATKFGDLTFEYMSGGVMHTTNSDNLEINLSFNPGISVFLFHNVCTSLSFEFGGFHYSSIRQYDELGEEVGSREAAKLRFKLNMLALNFGITVHFW